jgi:hypothetical protein
MELQDEFLAALQAGEQHDALLELAHRHQAQGMPAQETYRILHQLWLELGLNAAEEGNSLQDNLEYVMGKVWYECPASER